MTQITQTQDKIIEETMKESLEWHNKSDNYPSRKEDVEFAVRLAIQKALSQAEENNQTYVKGYKDGKKQAQEDVLKIIDKSSILDNWEKGKLEQALKQGDKLI